MDYHSEDLSDSSTATIEDELRKWPESNYTDIAEAEAQGRQAHQALIQQAESGHRSVWTVIVLLLIVCGISVLGWLYLVREPSVKQAASITNSVDLQNSKLDASPTENGEYYKRTEAKVSSQGREILEVVQYDFYSSRFIANNTALKNEGDLMALFQRMREELKDSWVLIFASASLEGEEDYNLDLCVRRLNAVKSMLDDAAKISARGYWGILAGEYKLDIGVPREKEEDEENRIARERGEKWLSPQRRLIVITIRELAPLAPDARDLVPFVVAKHVYEQGILPRTYDAPNSNPFPLVKKNDYVQPQRPTGAPHNDRRN